jgi:glucose/arabinose dehydrogenase
MVPRLVRLVGLVSVGVSAASAVVDVPDGFQDTLVATGLDAPTGFAFLPDRRVLFIEQRQLPPNEDEGWVFLWANGVLRGTPVLRIPDVVATGNEQGLLGIAVDPEWPARPYVYFYYNHAGGHNYVRMYTATGDLSSPASTNLAFSSPYDILTDIPDSFEWHNGGTLRFGPDGMLYVSQGDDAADNCNLVQNPSSWRGVILRLDVSALPGSGSGPPAKSLLVPPGNPWSGPDDNARLTYAVGFRNPFRFTIDDDTSRLFVGDVGEFSWEEVDEVQAGQNLGWPVREGAHAYPPGAGCPGGPGIDPIWEYAHDGVNPASVIAGPRYRLQGGIYDFPSGYDGNLFILDFYAGWLKRLRYNPVSGWDVALPVAGQPNPNDWGTGFTFVSDMQIGPDGALYYVTRSSTQFFRRVEGPLLLEADAAPAVFVPAVRISPNPIAAGAGRATVRFSVPEAGPVTVGVFDAAGRRVHLVFAGSLEAGTHEVHWDGTVTDGSGSGSSRATPGIYFVRIEAAGRPATTRVGLLD